MSTQTLPHARTNGAFVHVAIPAKPQGRIARAWFAVGTVAWCVVFGVWLALVVAFDAVRQDEINRKHGDGEA